MLSQNSDTLVHMDAHNDGYHIYNQTICLLMCYKTQASFGF